MNSLLVTLKYYVGAFFSWSFTWRMEKHTISKICSIHVFPKLWVQFFSLRKLNGAIIRNLQNCINCICCLIAGGGFAMAAASNESGLSSYLGKELVYLQVLHPSLILITVATATTFLTEVSSNTAIANIVLPVLAQMVRRTILVFWNFGVSEVEWFIHSFIHLFYIPWIFTDMELVILLT